jgi:serine/threonine kinase 38
VDWWSIGVMLFEMVVGYPPFFSDDPQTTCQKILHWKKTFQIPSDANLSQGCIDLIRRLIADPTERLGINGVQEIKAHPFFFGVDWKKIRIKASPYVPQINSDIDTENFEKFQEEDAWYIPEGKRVRKKANFHGYSFKRDTERERSPILMAIEDLENMKPIKPPQKMKMSQSPTEIP